MGRGWQLLLGNFGNVVSEWRRMIAMEDIVSFPEHLAKWSWRAACSSGAEGINV